MSQTILRTLDLAIGYKKKRGADHILHHNLNLELQAGEITCLLGPNGSGKSTLIRSLVGFQAPIQGQVYMGKKELADFSAAEISQMVSVVLTEQVSLENMTVFDMVAFGRSPYTGFLGTLKVDDKQKVEQALLDTGITQLHQRKIGELSDGERQKVMIAKSLAQETSVIFLDEPTAFLDFPSKVEILQLLRTAAWDHGKAILLSTHDLNLAIRFADKIWLMGKDKPMQLGVPEDLILDSHFGDFFDRKKTTFDMASGEFTFAVRPGGNIHVEGQGLRYDWLIRALHRKGFQTKDDQSCKLHVKVHEKQFELIHGSTHTVANSINEILVLLGEFEESTFNKS